MVFRENNEGIMGGPKKAFENNEGIMGGPKKA